MDNRAEKEQDINDIRTLNGKRTYSRTGIRGILLALIALTVALLPSAAWAQTGITSLSSITNMAGHYRITTNIDASSHATITGPFTGTLEAAIDPTTHMPYRITGLTTPLFATVTGTVKNLVVDNVTITNGDASGNTGAIAYINNGGTIMNCYTGELANIYTSNTVGGIVNTLTSGTVNHCRGEMNLRGSIVGGIAATQENGYIKNCFCDNAMMTITVTAGSGHYGGGMVGRMMKGWLENGFCNLGAVNRLDNQAKVGGIVGQIEGIGEGSGANTHIRNIYVYENFSSSRTFYGNTLNTMTFAQCYVIDGGTMQYGINAIAAPLTAPPTSSDINTAEGTIGQMRTLLNSFVETSGYPESWWKWSRTNDAPGSYSGGTGLPFLTL